MAAGLSTIATLIRLSTGLLLASLPVGGRTPGITDDSLPGIPEVLMALAADLDESDFPGCRSLVRHGAGPRRSFTESA